jgi:hypothetical protein
MWPEDEAVAPDGYLNVGGMTHICNRLYCVTAYLSCWPRDHFRAPRSVDLVATLKR